MKLLCQMCDRATMNTQQLVDFIRELRGVRNKSNELDNEVSLQNQQYKWRNQLDYELLESCIKNYNEEIRLEVLSLLVESKKTTLIFSEKEFELILQFISCNIGERLEFIPIVKKALKRTKESLAVLRRNTFQLEKIESCENKVTNDIEIYEQLRENYMDAANRSLDSINYYRAFFLKIRELCLSGICPGTTHIRRKNSLQILYLANEFLSNEFKDTSWAQTQADKLFQCLLLDTYEINKEVAYKILMQLDPLILRLDNEERVNEIIEVALKLGNSIRPIDSITASYMLKLGISSPVIKNVLKGYLNADSSLEHTDDIVLQLISIIVEELRVAAKLANDNVITTAAKHSLYGYLFCIKSLLSSCNLGKKVNDPYWIMIYDDIITLCLNLNQSVCQIVNNSSPEGHFPMDIGRKNLDESEEVLVTPQMVLLCSWRTVKEVSLLFGYLVEKSPIEGENENIGLLSKDKIIKIGDHLARLLCETKHRGAFEQAYVGFDQLCKRLWRLKDESLNQLPKIWLYELLLAITGLSPGNSKLCATRRSAGVPFMVQALIASEPSVSKKSHATVFHSVMRILLGLTEITTESQLSSTAKRLIESECYFSNVRSIEDKDDLSFICSENYGSYITITEVKTHALNILRALFKHAQLGDLTRTYAADGLIAAIKSYDERTWAERNAATLLYSSLITRIFGVQRTKDHVNLTVHNKMTGRIFFEKYPKLLPFMLRELKAFFEATDTVIKPSVQSILVLLSRLYVSYNSDSADINWNIEEFVRLVSSCAKSRVYNTRELAARALVPLLTGDTVVTFVNSLFALIKNGKNQRVNANLMHGYMLQIFEITKSSLLTVCEISKIHFEDFILGSEWILENLQIDNDNPGIFPLAAAFVDALNELMKKEILMENPLIFGRIIRRLLMHINGDNILKDRPGRGIYEASAAVLIISMLALKLQRAQKIQDAELLDTWGSILSHSNYQVQITGWTSAIEAIEQSCNLQFYQFTLSLALKNIDDIKNDPDLRIIIYDFLYNVFLKNENSVRPFDSDDNLLLLSKSIFNIFEKDSTHENASFFKLLGKSYGKLMKSKDQYIKYSLFGNKIYEIFRENSWTGSAGIDCRIAIATVLNDIYFDIRETRRKNANKMLLDWWTAELQLLVDDNSQVRKLASTVLSKINPKSEVRCDFYSLKLFFEKFSKQFDNEGGVIFSALFVWSLTLPGDNYEMDESDVFNKCYNYETFEPLRISDLCDEYLKILLNHYNIHTAFPVDVQEWLSQRLNIDFSQCKNPNTLIKIYQHRLPTLNDKLNDILDPTYNDKLLQVLAFKKFAILETTNRDNFHSSIN